MTDNMETVGPDVLTAPQFPIVNADHAMGLELQIVELVEQQTRARVQHRDADAERYEVEIGQLRAELASTADLSLPLI